MVIGQWKTGSPLSILRLWAVIKNEKKPVNMPTT